MSLSDRLKRVRESLGYTQKEMAKAISTNPQTWQVYEAGKSVPGGNVLEALARMGFNVNWILTGIGSKWVVTAGDVWSEKMKELRGNLDVPQFVSKLGIEDADIALETIQTIQAIENEKLDPDLGLLIFLQGELGISLDWFFGCHDTPMMHSGKVLLDKSAGGDIDLDVDVVDAIDRILNEKAHDYGELSGGKAILVMTTIYRIYSKNFIESSQFRMETMEKTIDALFRLALPIKEQAID